MSKEDAAKKAAKECDPQQWFAEQFDWKDVATFGKLVSMPSNLEIIMALDFLRGYVGGSPLNGVVK